MNRKMKINIRTNEIRQGMQHMRIVL